MGLAIMLLQFPVQLVFPYAWDISHRPRDISLGPREISRYSPKYYSYRRALHKLGKKHNPQRWLKKSKESYQLPPPSSPPLLPLESATTAGRIATAATCQHSTLLPLQSIAAPVTRQHSTPLPCRHVVAPIATPQPASAFHSLLSIMYANKTNGSYVHPPAGQELSRGSTQVRVAILIWWNTAR